MTLMIDRGILKYWAEKEVRIEAAHILDQIEDVLNHKSVQLTPFVSLAMREWVENILKKENMEYLAFGAFPDSERVRIIMGPKGKQLISEQAGISILEVCPLDPRIQLTHRQILGSLMGLGIKREVVGDIRVGQACAYVAINDDIVSFIRGQWDKAGRDKIKVKYFEGIPDIPLEQGAERRITVASSRIDAVLAGGFSVSRSAAQMWISQGKVKRNDIVIFKGDTEVNSGDVVSCRGQGRMRILENGGQTRKGRIAYKVLIMKTPQR